jgi:hypothetical protein
MESTVTGRQELRIESIRLSLIELKSARYDRPGVHSLRTDLEKDYHEILELVKEQSVGKDPGYNSAQIKKLRDEILKRLRELSRRAIMALKGLPGIEHEMRIPRSNVKSSDILDGAKRIIKNVRPHLDTLQTKGLAKNAIASLEKVAKELDAMVNTADPSIARRAQATRALPDVITHGRDIIDLLDASFRVEFAGEKLSSWDRAKRIPGRVGRPKNPRKKK